LLDHVIALNQRHLKRLLSDYGSYYHEDRMHLGLKKQTPAGRARSLGNRQVTCQQRLGGLHHRYDSGCLNRLCAGLDLFERTAEVSAHSARYDEVQLVWSPHTATSWIWRQAAS
jgi:hypothetical protein